MDADGALWWRRIPIAVAGATIMMTASTTVLTSAAVMTAAVTAHEPFQETHHFSFVDGSSLRPRGVGCCDDLRCDASANACSK